MDGRDKLESRARRNPGGLRIEEVLRLARAAGIEVTRTTGGHYVLSHAKLPNTLGVAEPHGGGDSFVKSVYVRKLLRAVDIVRAAPED